MNSSQQQMLNECHVGEGDHFKALEWNTKEEDKYTGPMSAVISRICLGGEVIFFSLQRSGYSFTDFYYDSIKNTMERRSMHPICNSCKNKVESSCFEHLMVSQVSPNKTAYSFVKAQDRLEKLARYRSKRDKRNYGKIIKYKCRKIIADNQKRIRGKFAKKIS